MLFRSHLTDAEVDAIVASPDQTTHRGRRDHALLLFLARTGARVSEAIGVNASELHLQRGRPQVLLHGKGRRDRVVPMPRDLVRSLTELLKERGLDDVLVLVGGIIPDADVAGLKAAGVKLPAKRRR